jgi:hypothetical protein
LDLSRLPASQRYKRHQDCWKRYEKPQPSHRVQVDVKFVAPIGGLRKKHYQFTAIDDCTRLRVLRVFDHLNQKTAIRFQLLKQHGGTVLCRDPRSMSGATAQVRKSSGWRARASS